MSTRIDHGCAGPTVLPQALLCGTNVRSNSKQELILLAVIALEIAFFSVTGQNFFSLSNFFECVRLGVEIGLLALALTPVIVTGGIDLSVGSVAGLGGMVAGYLLTHGISLGGAVQYPGVGVAVLLTLLVCLMVGLVNGWLVAKVGVAPFIATLGMSSVLAGVAYWVTDGVQVVGDATSTFAA